MTNTSKKILKKDVAKRIHSRFLKTLVDLRGKSGEGFLEEIFTPSEQIMLAKRISALFLLSRGVSSYRTRLMLKLSPTTTARLKRELDHGKYPSIKNICKNKKSKDQLWADIEVFIRMGMPEMGSGRWKWLKDI